MFSHDLTLNEMKVSSYIIHNLYKFITNPIIIEELPRLPLTEIVTSPILLQEIKNVLKMIVSTHL